MADDAQIRIGMSIDTSGLAAAESAAKASAKVVASAYKAVADAQVAVWQSSSRMKDINEQIKKGMLDSATAATVLSEELQIQTDTTNKLKTAKLDLADATARAAAADISAAQARSSAAASGGMALGGQLPGVNLRSTEEHSTSAAAAVASLTAARGAGAAAASGMAEAEATAAEAERVESGALGQVNVALRSNAEMIASSAAAVNSLTAARTQSAEAAMLSANADRTATDAEIVEAAALDEDTAALRGNYLTRRTATEEMYVLQGSTYGAARAIGDFASRIPAIGGLINTAFSAFIVVAFAEMAYAAGKAMYDAFDMGGVEAAKFQELLVSTNDSWQTLIDSTAVETDKLDIATAKLEHKPMPNAQKIAMDEAADAADKLNSKLDSLLAKEQTLIESKALNPSWEATLTGIGGTHQEQVMLQQHQLHMDETTTQSGALKESESFAKSLQTRLKELKDWQANPSPTRMANNLPNEIQATEVMIAQQKKEQQAIQDTIGLQDAQARNAKAEAEHSAAAGAGRAGAKENYSDELAKQEAYQGKSLGSTVLFWEKVVKATGDGHNAQLQSAKEAFEKQVNEKGKFASALAKHATGAAPDELCDRLDGQGRNRRAESPADEPQPGNKTEGRSRSVRPHKEADRSQREDGHPQAGRRFPRTDGGKPVGGESASILRPGAAEGDCSARADRARPDQGEAVSGSRGQDHTDQEAGRESA